MILQKIIRGEANFGVSQRIPFIHLYSNNTSYLTNGKIYMAGFNPNKALPLSVELTRLNKNNQIQTNNLSPVNVTVSAYSNLLKVYEWYKTNLSWDSIDGKGQCITCFIVPESAAFLKKVGISGGMVEDNAFCTSVTSSQARLLNSTFPELPTIKNAVLVIPTSFNKTKYPVAVKLDVIGHEFTHGVFLCKTGVRTIECTEAGGINEAYADIFGCLIEGNWIVAENAFGINKPIRNLTSSSIAKYKSAQYNSYSNEEHDISMTLSRVAFLMSQRGFSNTDIAKIWFKSLDGSWSKTSTFVNARTNVINAMRALGYKPAKITVAENCFKEMGILLPGETMPGGGGGAGRAIAMLK